MALLFQNKAPDGKYSVLAASSLCAFCPDSFTFFFSILKSFGLWPV